MMDGAAMHRLLVDRHGVRFDYTMRTERGKTWEDVARAEDNVGFIEKLHAWALTSGVDVAPGDADAVLPGLQPQPPVGSELTEPSRAGKALQP